MDFVFPCGNTSITHLLLSLRGIVEASSRQMGFKFVASQCNLMLYNGHATNLSGSGSPRADLMGKGEGRSLTILLQLNPYPCYVYGTTHNAVIVSEKKNLDTVDCEPSLGHRFVSKLSNPESQALRLWPHSSSFGALSPV